MLKLHKRKPDVLCLQEVLQGRVDYLKELGYSTCSVEDYQHIKGQTGYIATGVKNKRKFIESGRYRYFAGKMDSLWSKLIYTKMYKMNEMHESLVTTVRQNGQLLRIVNVHLSTACGPQVRVEQIRKVLEKFSDERSIICGDFNVISDPFYKIFAGWACGYRLQDYFFDERAEVNRIIKEHDFQNPFARKKTTVFPFYQQLDHILVPRSIKIASKKIYKIALSDHRALSVDIVV